jgi:hypothetical protein
MPILFRDQSLGERERFPDDPGLIVEVFNESQIAKEVLLVSSAETYSAETLGQECRWRSARHPARTFSSLEPVSAVTALITPPGFHSAYCAS